MPNKYQKKYQQSERGKIVTRESAKKYWKTPQGVKVRRAYLERNAERLRKYQIDYHSKARQRARALGLCSRCRKFPVASKSFAFGGERKLSICSNCIEAAAVQRAR